MKKWVCRVIFILCFALCGQAFAEVVPVPITAEKAFDAAQTQTDPVSGGAARVALVDVRSRAEFFWVGAASRVDEIETFRYGPMVPDYGKVVLAEGGRYLLFKINGLDKRLETKKVLSLSLAPIAINIPYKLWDEGTGTLVENSNFGAEVEALSADYDVLIFFCRSGGRSEACLAAIDTSLFDKLYEIDQPDGESGMGGFEGTSYSNIYNGYRGFPQRSTFSQAHPSVSWKDAGLPIKTSVNPLAK